MPITSDPCPQCGVPLIVRQISQGRGYYIHVEVCPDCEYHTEPELQHEDA